MPKYIERTEIERFIAEHGRVGPFSVDLLPSADVAPVRHGKWLHHTMIDGHIHAECSECHKVRIIDNYCPNCGAKMDGGDGNA